VVQELHLMVSAWRRGVVRRAGVRLGTHTTDAGDGTGKEWHGGHVEREWRLKNQTEEPNQAETRA
jgi:hypothetical protein